MPTPLLAWLEKADFLTSDLSGGTDGGLLSPMQARTFLRDAIEASVILKAADVFDSINPVFEIPKINFANRIMYAGVEGARVISGERQKPTTGLVTLVTKLFKGEVPVSDETFEDNVERDGLANTLMTMIAEAVGRDLEEIAIKSDTGDADPDFNQFNGIIQSLVDSTTANEEDVSGAADYRAMFDLMIAALPTRYRRDWSTFVFYVSPAVADGYAGELGDRGTALGDSNISQRPMLRYRSIPVEEVPLFSGTQNAVDYGTFAILCNPKNLKVGFHRKVRMEKFRDPREGMTSFLPTVRYDMKWAQDSAVVLGTGVPAL